MRRARPSRVTPALLTSTRIGPCSSSMRVKAASTLAVSRHVAVAAGQPDDVAAVATQALDDRRADAPLAAGDDRAARPQRADMHALLPAHDAGAPDEAGAEGGHQDVRPGPQAAVGLGALERQRDRGGRRVGAALDVEDDAIGRQPELGGGRLDDARVGLVGDEQVDVADLEPGPVERVAGGLDHPRDRMPVDASGPPCAASARCARRRAHRPARGRCRGRSRRRRPRDRRRRRRRRPPRRRRGRRCRGRRRR